MANVHIISGTVMGTAEFVSEEIEAKISEDGHDVTLHAKPDTDKLMADAPDVLVVCSSTTGNGELPEEIQDFHAWLSDDKPSLGDLNYLVVALGDSSYEDFCGGGRLIDQALKNTGANAIAERLDIDGSEDFEPEVAAVEWVSNNLQSYL